MAYITQADFSSYSSTVISGDGFPQLAWRASEIIDTLTGHKIPSAGGLGTFPAPVQEQVKKAVCAQVETMDAQGGNDTLVGNGSDADIKNASLGKFSYSTGTGSSVTSGEVEKLNGIPISPLLKGYLWPTGLLYRGVAHLG